MNARNELAKRLVAMVSEETTANAETINGILKDYTILREAEDEKSDLNKRIVYYLGAKRIDGLSPRTLNNYKYTLEMFTQRMNKRALAPGSKWWYSFTACSTSSSPFLESKTNKQGAAPSWCGPLLFNTNLALFHRKFMDYLIKSPFMYRFTMIQSRKNKKMCDKAIECVIL